MIDSRSKSGVQRSSSELEISNVDEAEGHGGEERSSKSSRQETR
jgi:hypothetical protein